MSSEAKVASSPLPGMSLQAMFSKDPTASRMPPSFMQTKLRREGGARREGNVVSADEEYDGKDKGIERH